MEYLKALEWRYATKKFDANKKLDQQTFERIITAGNLAASSLGLQLLKIINVVNPETRERLKLASYNQSQVTDASHFIVICGEKNITSERIEEQMQLISKTREVDRASLDGFYKSANNFVTNFSSDQERLHWISKQGYIVLGQLMTACAIEKVDSCPMEGFQPHLYSEILDLEAKNLFPILALPMGYRSVEDKNQHLKKVRQSLNDYIINL